MKLTSNEELEKLRKFKELSLEYMNGWARSGTIAGTKSARLIRDIMAEAGVLTKEEDVI